MHFTFSQKCNILNFHINAKHRNITKNYISAKELCKISCPQKHNLIRKQWTIFSTTSFIVLYSVHYEPQNQTQTLSVGSSKKMFVLSFKLFKTLNIE
jgi:hypothetical protein